MKKYNYSKLLVIAHGKSEYDIFAYIFSVLNMPKKTLFARKRGNKFNSIQITSLMNVLEKNPFDSEKNFDKRFDTIEKVQKNYVNFKIAVVMDTDDCSIQQREHFLSKKMFEGHWLYDYIYPVHNTENLEAVLKKTGIKYPNSKKEDYQKVFPVQRGVVPKDSIKLVSDKLASFPKSNNLYQIFNYLLDGE